MSDPGALGSVTERVCGIRLDAIYRHRVTGDIYKVQTVCEHPTLSLKCVAGVEEGARVSGAIGAPIFADFVELVPKDEVQ